MKRPKVKVLSDCDWDEPPECFHCGKKYPDAAKVELNGKNLIVQCPSCGCMTPFPVVR